MTLKFEKPNDALMGDLNDVSAAASKFRARLQSTSAVPNDFPQEPTKAMLQSLIGLPNGTAAGARPILHAADKRLTKLRHKYFRKKPSDTVEDDRNISPVERDQPLDDILSKLKTAIDTALEECRIQEVGEDADDDFDPWGYDKYDNEADTDSPAKGRHMDARMQSDVVEAAIDKTRKAADELLNAETVNTDNFNRSLSDTQNLNIIIKAELLYARGKQSVRDTLASAMENRPKIMRAMADQLEAGLDYSQDVAVVIKAFKDDPLGTVVKACRGLPDMLRNKANEIEATNSTLPPIPEVDEARQEEAERIATELLEQSKPVPNDVAKEVRILHLMESNFSDTALLKNMRYLQVLSLKDTKITTVAPLSTFVYLEVLNLWNTDVTDITPLIGLKRLKYLDIDNCPIEDITSLSSLKSLYILDAADTKVTNWWPVEHVELVEGRPDNWRDLPRP